MKLHLTNTTPDRLLIVRSYDGVTHIGTCHANQTTEIDCPVEVEITIASHDGTEISSIPIDLVATGNAYWLTTGYTLETWGHAYSGVPDDINIPGIGTVTVPEWATGNSEMGLFFIGFATAAGIAMVRAGLRWFKRADGVGLD